MPNMKLKDQNYEPKFQKPTFNSSWFDPQQQQSNRTQINKLQAFGHRHTLRFLERTAHSSQAGQWKRELQGTTRCYRGTMRPVATVTLVGKQRTADLPAWTPGPLAAVGAREPCSRCVLGSQSSFRAEFTSVICVKTAHPLPSTCFLDLESFQPMANGLTVAGARAAARRPGPSAGWPRRRPSAASAPHPDGSLSQQPEKSHRSFSAPLSRHTTKGVKRGRFTTHLDDRQVKDLAGLSHLWIVPIFRDDVRSERVVRHFLRFPGFQKLNNLQKAHELQWNTPRFNAYQRS